MKYGHRPRLLHAGWGAAVLHSVLYCHCHRLGHSLVHLVLADQCNSKNHTWSKLLYSICLGLGLRILYMQQQFSDVFESLLMRWSHFYIIEDCKNHAWSMLCCFCCRYYTTLQSSAVCSISIGCTIGVVWRHISSSPVYKLYLFIQYININKKY